MTGPPQHFSLLKDRFSGLLDSQKANLGDIIEVILSLPQGAFLEQHGWRAVDHLVLGVLRGAAGSEAALDIDGYVELRRAMAEGAGDRGGAGELLRVLRRFPAALDVFEVGKYLVVVASPASAEPLPPKDKLFTAVQRLVRGSCTTRCDPVDLQPVMEELLGEGGGRRARLPWAGVVFGVDEGSGKLFAHLLPPALAWAAAALGRLGGLDEHALRELMGFDLQPWEARGPPSPGARVRVQGDLTVEVLEYCPERGCKLARLIVALKLLSRLEALAAGPPMTPDNLFEDSGHTYIIIVDDLIVDYYELIEIIKDDSEGDSNYSITFLRVSLDSGELFSLDPLVDLIAPKAQEELELELFEATINGTHVVRGYGTAIAFPMPQRHIRPHTTRARMKGALGTLKDGLAGQDPVTVLRGLAGLLSVMAYYGRIGDLYLYTADGRLYFKHREHGEAFLDLGGPAVVRVTTLNAQAPPGFM